MALSERAVWRRSCLLGAFGVLYNQAAVNEADKYRVRIVDELALVVTNRAGVFEHYDLAPTGSALRISPARAVFRGQVVPLDASSSSSSSLP